MDDIDILLSNGTCYYGVRMESSDNVIPCGNAANDVYPCCQAGDFCLEYNVCFNENYTTTYLAGCTDPEFGRSCPVKDHSGQQLLGLVQCAGTDTSDGEVLWSGCPGPATRTALGQPSVCDCTGTADGLLYAPTSLAAVASLPTRVGEPISFADGHTPSRITVPSSPVSTSVDGTMTATATPTSIPISTSTFSDPQELSTGAKAGIGVGAVALGLAALGLVLWFSTWYRRKRIQEPVQEASSNHPTPTDQNGLAIPIPIHQRTPGYYYPSEAGSITGSVPPSYTSPEWPGYSGFKSELPADSERGFRSELPAEELAIESATDTQRAGSPSTSPPPPPSEPGSPAHHYTGGTITSISDVSSILSGSPLTQSGQWQRDVSPSEADEGENRGQMTPIIEVHGDVEDMEMPVRHLK